MKFHTIKHIKDVEKAIDINCFFIGQKDGYQVVNYRFSSPEAFPDLASADDAVIKREFRGLIFDMEGNLIRRPWHKFFNVGERVETTLANIDVSKKHIILEKLDGSMISPFMVGGELLWGTKMGQTEISDQVRDWLKNKPKYEKYSKEWIGLGWTPIFEWCSNQNRIVVDYPQSNLILTGMRFMSSGQYMDYGLMCWLAQTLEIPVVKSIDGALNEAFVDFVKNNQDSYTEGFVIVFEDGQRYKIKTDQYCQLHRVKSEINFERGVVTLLLNEKMDDLKSMMPANDLQRIEEYEAKFIENSFYCVESVGMTLKFIKANNFSRKDFALGISKNLEPWHVNAVFKMFDQPLFKSWVDIDSEIYDLLKQHILKNCNRNNKFAELRKTQLFKNVPEWKPVMFSEDEVE